MLDFPRSKITLPSDIAGAKREQRRRKRFEAARRFASSLTAKLIVLVAIFVALPILVYGQFEQADSKLRELVTRSIQHHNWLIAQAMRPALDQPARMPEGAKLSADLAQYAQDGTGLQLMLRPAARGAGGQFYYVAASSSLSPDNLDAELDSLASHGILDRLSRSCADDTPIDVQYRRPGGKDDILTSLIPIQTRWGCWALVSSHTTAEYLYTSIARPFWATPEVRIVMLIYLLGALLAVLVVTSVSRSLRHFRRVAAEIRQDRARHFTFAARDVPLELASVASDFDALALDLRKVAYDIRQTAEDNAHSFKAPVATIEASLETARHGLQPGDGRAERAIELIASSIGRLKTLISAAQCLDNVTATLIETPRLRVDVTAVVTTVLHRARDLLTQREIQIVQNLHEKAFVDASQDILEESIENILDNAISFSPRRSIVAVTLIKSRECIDLRIDDQGPGIDASKIDRIFDRYFSLRANADADERARAPVPHAGLGLWIVRRNIEALGGVVTATNLPGAGLSVHIVLPTSRG